MIQHDCGHGSFFRRRWANNCLGRMIGVLTLTPYAFWRRRHALHHAGSGNLDRRGIGDITTLTRTEYLASSAWRRALYRLYRHPVVMFVIGPVYVFWIRHRIPSGNPRREWRSWISVLGTNIAIAATMVAFVETGCGAFLLAYVPTVLMAGVIGVWLFYIQHQFEDTYWEAGTQWDFHAAALRGCSFYDLPRPLHWLTCHIGLHHIHHLSSKIPNYRLRECFEQNPTLQGVRRVGLWESLGCARLAIWDEDSKKLVSIRDVRQRATRALRHVHA
jgi:omega-6 fatty acid desaturase (delta-12 desaturase)